MTKRCVICGKEFEAIGPGCFRRITCGLTCASARERQKIKTWRCENKAHIAIQKRKWGKLNPEAIKRSRFKTRIKNHDKILEKNRAYRELNRKEIREKVKRIKKQDCLLLRDPYIKHSLCIRTNLKHNQCTPGLIAIERRRLKLMRFLNQKQNQ